MEQNRTKLLFPILRSAMMSQRLTEEEKAGFSAEDREALFSLAKKHDLSHLLALGLKSNGLAPEGDQRILGDIMQAALRHEKSKAALAQLAGLLQEAKIPFLPLKGAVIRHLYPEPWMRTSCDIDILVPEREADRAGQISVEKGGFVWEGKGTHDISLRSATGQHMELHYSLMENFVAAAPAGVLSRVWDTAHLHAESGFWYEMPDEMLYFYHVAHMAKHFLNGGCGIRPLLDLWLLDQNAEALEKRDALLAEGELLTFAGVVRQLSRVWFQGEAHTPFTRKMEEFILRGGVYGTAENGIRVQQRRRGGRLHYLLSKAFLPYAILKTQYPILERYPILLPVMEVRRWGRLLFCGHMGRVSREIRYNASITEEESREMGEFLSALGLPK